MKKLLSVIMAGLLVLSCGACSKEDPDISGYYALTEIAQNGEVVFNEDEIKEYLYPSFGHMYLDVADDGTALLNVAGFEENTVYDLKEKTFVSTDPIMEDSYSFEYKKDQLILTEQGEDKFVLTFTRSERPSEEDFLPIIDSGDSPDDIGITVDPSAPGYVVYETERLKVYVQEELETYLSDDPEYDLIVDGEKVGMFVQSILISEFTDQGLELEDVREAVYEGNDVVEGDLRYMSYTAEDEGTEYFFIYTLLNDEEYFYDITLVCYNEEKDLYQDAMLDIISRIQMKYE